jgi:predicted deacetylase
MIAAMSTLAFLASLWLLAVVGAAVLEESGAKIAAALKGETAAPQLPLVRVRVRSAVRPVARRAAPRLRAAA